MHTSVAWHRHSIVLIQRRGVLRHTLITSDNLKTSAASNANSALGTYKKWLTKDSNAVSHERRVRWPFRRRVRWLHACCVLDTTVLSVCRTMVYIPAHYACDRRTDVGCRWRSSRMGVATMTATGRLMWGVGGVLAGWVLPL